MQEHEQSDVREITAKSSRGVMVYACIATMLVLLCVGVILWLCLRGTQNDKQLALVDQTQDLAEQQIGQALQTTSRSVVAIRADGSDAFEIGTGIILTQDGYIVTNAHVIYQATQVQVVCYDGTELRAAVIRESDSLDMALLKVDSEQPMEPATFATAKTCHLGQTVYAIGTPSNVQYGWSVSRGIVSYVNRPVAYNGKTVNMLQTDAAINHGNSGGPLVNTAGQVLGIVTSRLSGDYQGVSFAIPSDAAIAVLNQWLPGALQTNSDMATDTDVGSETSEFLTGSTPRLGVEVVLVERDRAYLFWENEYRELSEVELETADENVVRPFCDGAYVLSIAKGYDVADTLVPGDIIVSINEKFVSEIAVLTDEVASLQSGDTVTIGYMRGEIMEYAEVVLGAK